MLQLNMFGRHVPTRRCVAVIRLLKSESGATAIVFLSYFTTVAGCNRATTGAHFRNLCLWLMTFKFSTHGTLLSSSVLCLWLQLCSQITVLQPRVNPPSATNFSKTKMRSCIDLTFPPMHFGRRVSAGLGLPGSLWAV